MQIPPMSGPGYGTGQIGDPKAGMQKNLGEIMALAFNMMPGGPDERGDRAAIERRLFSIDQSLALLPPKEQNEAKSRRLKLNENLNKLYAGCEERPANAGRVFEEKLSVINAADELMKFLQ